MLRISGVGTLRQAQQDPAERTYFYLAVAIDQKVQSRDSCDCLFPLHDVESCHEQGTDEDPHRFPGSLTRGHSCLGSFR